METHIFKNEADLYETLRIIGAMFKGDHVEIGTLNGKSAFIMAHARPSAHIYCVDPMEKQKANDQYQGIKETGHSAIFIKNREDEKLIEQITLIQEYSLPWPLPPEQRFDTALIDGYHVHPIPMWEFEILSKIVNGAIVIDNADLFHLTGCITKIRMTPGWVLEYAGKKVAVAWNEQWLLQTGRV